MRSNGADRFHRPLDDGWQLETAFLPIRLQSSFYELHRTLGPTDHLGTINNINALLLRLRWRGVVVQPAWLWESEGQNRKGTESSLGSSRKCPQSTCSNWSISKSLSSPRVFLFPSQVAAVLVAISVFLSWPFPVGWLCALLALICWSCSLIWSGLCTTMHQSQSQSQSQSHTIMEWTESHAA